MPATQLPALLRDVDAIGITVDTALAVEAMRDAPHLARQFLRFATAAHTSNLVPAAHQASRGPPTHTTGCPPDLCADGCKCPGDTWCHVAHSGMHVLVRKQDRVPLRDGLRARGWHGDVSRSTAMFSAVSGVTDLASLVYGMDEGGVASFRLEIIGAKTDAHDALALLTRLCRAGSPSRVVLDLGGRLTGAEVSDFLGVPAVVVMGEPDDAVVPLLHLADLLEEEDDDDTVAAAAAADTDEPELGTAARSLFLG